MKRDEGPMLQQVLDFLRALKANNHREWFEAHRSTYEQARLEFEDLVDTLVWHIAQRDADICPLPAREYIYRIYRDMRFVRDGKPYKEHFGAFIAPEGRRSHSAGYYIHIEADNSFVAVGTPPIPSLLKPIRHHIVRHADQWLDVLNDVRLRSFFPKGIDTARYRRVPKGVPSDFPHPELVTYRHYAMTHFINDELLQSQELVAHVLEVLYASMPFVRLLRQALAHEA